MEIPQQNVQCALCQQWICKFLGTASFTGRIKAPYFENLQSVFNIIYHDFCVHTQVIVTKYYTLKILYDLGYNSCPYS